MGCGGSTEAEVVVEEVQVEEVDVAEKAAVVVATLDIAESESVKAKPTSLTFIGSVLKLREKLADNAEVMLDCCTRLQAYNRRLKEYIAVYDCEAVHEAMNGGFMGLGCNDTKLITAVCTRTKKQLQLTKKQH